MNNQLTKISCILLGIPLLCISLCSIPFIISIVNSNLRRIDAENICDSQFSIEFQNTACKVYKKINDNLLGNSPVVINTGVFDSSSVKIRKLNNIKDLYVLEEYIDPGLLSMHDGSISHLHLQFQYKGKYLGEIDYGYTTQSGIYFTAENDKRILIYYQENNAAFLQSYQLLEIDKLKMQMNYYLIKDKLQEITYINAMNINPDTLEIKLPGYVDLDFKVTSPSYPITTPPYAVNCTDNPDIYGGSADIISNKELPHEDKGYYVFKYCAYLSKLYSFTGGNVFFQYDNSDPKKIYTSMESSLNNDYSNYLSYQDADINILKKMLSKLPAGEKVTFYSKKVNDYDLPDDKEIPALKTICSQKSLNCIFSNINPT